MWPWASFFLIQFPSVKLLQEQVVMKNLGEADRFWTRGPQAVGFEWREQPRMHGERRSRLCPDAFFFNLFLNWRKFAL